MGNTIDVAYANPHQAKEIARLNSVYNKLLTDAGVEMFGKQLLLPGIQPCTCIQASYQSVCNRASKPDDA